MVVVLLCAHNRETNPAGLQELATPRPVSSKQELSIESHLGCHGLDRPVAVIELAKATCKGRRVIHGLRLTVNLTDAAIVASPSRGLNRKITEVRTIFSNFTSGLTLQAKEIYVDVLRML